MAMPKISMSQMERELLEARLPAIPLEIKALENELLRVKAALSIDQLPYPPELQGAPISVQILFLLRKNPGVSFKPTEIFSFIRSADADSWVNIESVRVVLKKLLENEEISRMGFGRYRALIDTPSTNIVDLFDAGRQKR